MGLRMSALQSGWWTGGHHRRSVRLMGIWAKCEWLGIFVLFPAIEKQRYRLALRFRVSVNTCELWREAFKLESINLRTQLESKVCWTGVPIRSSLGRAWQVERKFPMKIVRYSVSKKKSFSSKCDVLVSFALTKRWWCRRPSCPLWLHAAAECQLASGGPCIEGSCAVRRTTAVDVSVGACEPFPLCPLWLADVLRRSSSLGSRLTELVRLNYKKLLKKCYFVFKNLTRVYDLVDIECFNF